MFNPWFAFSLNAFQMGVEAQSAPEANRNKRRAMTAPAVKPKRPVCLPKRSLLPRRLRPSRL
jgi:hypothetical protein